MNLGQNVNAWKFVNMTINECNFKKVGSCRYVAPDLKKN